MPAITSATCFILIVTWLSPVPVYAGEIQGVVWVDGEAQLLHLEQARPEAIWTARLQPGQWVVDYAFVATLGQPGAFEISNTPYPIECWQAWLPVVVQE